MFRTQSQRPRRIITRVRRTWAELDNAQRALFEIRTGIPVRDRGVTPRA